MIRRRGALPLLATGSAGLALFGLGLTGLSAIDPELQSAAATVERERRSTLVMQNVVDCPPKHQHHPAHRPTPEV